MPKMKLTAKDYLTVVLAFLVILAVSLWIGVSPIVAKFKQDPRTGLWYLAIIMGGSAFIATVLVVLGEILKRVWKWLRGVWAKQLKKTLRPEWMKDIAKELAKFMTGLSGLIARHS